MSQNLEKMGEDIRVQGGQGTGKMTDLFFNTTTGEFETRAQGSASAGDEAIVTEMTEKGFARP